MRDALTVARWELTRLLKRKDFVISTLLIPVMAAAGIGVGQYFQKRSENKVTTVAVVRADGGEAAMPVVKGYRWTTPAPNERTRAALTRAVNEKRVDGALIIPLHLADADTVDALVRWPRQQWVRDLKPHLLSAVRDARARDLGLSDSTLSLIDQPVQIEQRVTVSTGSRSRADRIIAFASIILFIMALFTAISYMGIGISGEKQARVTEVIISAVSPQSWIDGKVAAYTLVGLIQALVWGLTVLGVVVVLAATLPKAIHPGTVMLSILFASFGFAFYVAMFAMIMATIKDLQSTTKFQAYLMFIPFLPFTFMEAVISDPDALWVVVLSQLPIFSPMLIPARAAIGGIAPWEPFTAFALLLVGFHFMRLAAGAAFRIGMLMYGKEVTLPELWRWSRIG